METLRAFHTSPGHVTDEHCAACGYLLENITDHRDANEALLPMICDPAVADVLPANDYRAAVLSQKQIRFGPPPTLHPFLPTATSDLGEQNRTMCAQFYCASLREVICHKTLNMNLPYLRESHKCGLRR